MGLSSLYWMLFAFDSAFLHKRGNMWIAHTHTHVYIAGNIKMKNDKIKHWGW